MPETLKLQKKKVYNESYMRHMLDTGRNKTMEGIEEIEKFYKDCIVNSASSIREYILYKLLNYRGIHSQLQELFNDSLRDYLSLESKKNDAASPSFIPSASENPGFNLSYTLPPLYKIDV